MKFLIDTNVLIPLEPTRLQDEELLTPQATQFLRLVQESRFQVFVHPAASVDIGRDRDIHRSRLRRVQMSKYPLLPDPPRPPATMTAVLGEVPSGSNNWVDHQLLAALVVNAVDFLVTEDQQLHRKTRRLDLGERILTLGDALELVRRLTDQPVDPPPRVEAVKAHAIQPDDPILESFRDDYPGFDRWFQKCCREHRQAWIIRASSGWVDGFCIVNEEQHPPAGLDGRVLKICSFKVAPHAVGRRFGELLLKAVFTFVHENSYDWLFITTFDKQAQLVDLLRDFGFEQLVSRIGLRELVFAKPLQPAPGSEDSLGSLPFHIRFGPHYFRQDVPWYLVPIQPRYGDVLFPETASQASLFPGEQPFGNAIRKAYLCHSNLRSVAEGDVLVFYRSEVDRGVIALGVVEDTLVSSSAEDILRWVGKRTVYSMGEIETMAAARAVLVVRFRQARFWKVPVHPSTLQRVKVFKRAPQSIQTIQPEAIAWLMQHLPR